LRHVADTGADFERSLRNIQAEHRHAPICRLDETEQRFEQRALPCAIGPQEAYGAGIEPGGDLLERAIVTVDDRDTVEVHNGLSGCRGRSLARSDNVTRVQVSSEGLCPSDSLTRSLAGPHDPRSARVARFATLARVFFRAALPRRRTGPSDGAKGGLVGAPAAA